MASIYSRCKRSGAGFVWLPKGSPTYLQHLQDNGAILPSRITPGSRTDTTYNNYSRNSSNSPKRATYSPYGSHRSEQSNASSLYPKTGVHVSRLTGKTNATTSEEISELTPIPNPVEQHKQRKRILDGRINRDAFMKRNGGRLGDHRTPEELNKALEEASNEASISYHNLTRPATRNPLYYPYPIQNPVGCPEDGRGSLLYRSRSYISQNSARLPSVIVPTCTSYIQGKPPTQKGDTQSSCEQDYVVFGKAMGCANRLVKSAGNVDSRGYSQQEQANPVKNGSDKLLLKTRNWNLGQKDIFQKAKHKASPTLCTVYNDKSFAVVNEPSVDLKGQNSKCQITVFLGSTLEPQKNIDKRASATPPPIKRRTTRLTPEQQKQEILQNYQERPDKIVVGNLKKQQSSLQSFTESQEPWSSESSYDSDCSTSTCTLSFTEGLAFTEFKCESDTYTNLNSSFTSVDLKDEMDSEFTSSSSTFTVVSDFVDHKYEKQKPFSKGKLDGNKGIKAVSKNVSQIPKTSLSYSRNLRPEIAPVTTKNLQKITAFEESLRKIAAYEASIASQGKRKTLNRSKHVFISGKNYILDKFLNNPPERHEPVNTSSHMNCALRKSTSCPGRAGYLAVADDVQHSMTSNKKLNKYGANTKRAHLQEYMPGEQSRNYLPSQETQSAFMAMTFHRVERLQTRRRSVLDTSGKSVKHSYRKKTPKTSMKSDVVNNDSTTDRNRKNENTGTQSPILNQFQKATATLNMIKAKMEKVESNRQKVIDQRTTQLHERNQRALKKTQQLAKLKNDRINGKNKKVLTVNQKQNVKTSVQTTGIYNTMSSDVGLGSNIYEHEGQYTINNRSIVIGEIHTGSYRNYNAHQRSDFCQYENEGISPDNERVVKCDNDGRFSKQKLAKPIKKRIVRNDIINKTSMNVQKSDSNFNNSEKALKFIIQSMAVSEADRAENNKLKMVRGGGIQLIFTDESTSEVDDSITEHYESSTVEEECTIKDTESSNETDVSSTVGFTTESDWVTADDTIVDEEINPKNKTELVFLTQTHAIESSTNTYTCIRRSFSQPHHGQVNHYHHEVNTSHRREINEDGPKFSDLYAEEHDIQNSLRNGKSLVLGLNSQSRIAWKGNTYSSSNSSDTSSVSNPKFTKTLRLGSESIMKQNIDNNNNDYDYSTLDSDSDSSTDSHGYLYCSSNTESFIGQKSARENFNLDEISTTSGSSVYLAEKKQLLNRSSNICKKTGAKRAVSNLEWTLRSRLNASKSISDNLPSISLGQQRNLTVDIKYIFDIEEWSEHVSKSRFCLPATKDFLTRVRIFFGLKEVNRVPNSVIYRKLVWKYASEKAVRQWLADEYGVVDGTFTRGLKPGVITFVRNLNTEGQKLLMPKQSCSDDSSSDESLHSELDLKDFETLTEDNPHVKPQDQMLMASGYLMAELETLLAKYGFKKNVRDQVQAVKLNDMVCMLNKVAPTLTDMEVMQPFYECISTPKHLDALVKYIQQDLHQLEQSLVKSVVQKVILSMTQNDINMIFDTVVAQLKNDLDYAEETFEMLRVSKYLKLVEIYRKSALKVTRRLKENHDMPWY